MSDMSDYQINEKDIESVIRYMKIHDPKNADREYAIQFLESLQGVAGELVNTDVEFAERLEKALKKRN
jgi:hypothetical protein